MVHIAHACDASSVLGTSAARDNAHSRGTVYASVDLVKGRIGPVGCVRDSCVVDSFHAEYRNDLFRRDAHQTRSCWLTSLKPVVEMRSAMGIRQLPANQRL